MATGTTIIDFGAFPGSSHATVAVTGQTAIVATSLVAAWIDPIATADHTADEHMLAEVKFHARDIAEGVGFTIHGLNTDKSIERHDHLAKHATAGAGTLRDRLGGGSGIDTHNKCTLLYGLYSVAWAWK